MRPLLVVVLFAASVIRANAQISVKQYQDVIATNDSDAIHLIRSYIKGLGEGFLFYSVRAENSMNQKPLFCQPAKLALNTENYVDILNREIEKAAGEISKDKLDAFPLAPILLSGLQTSFPCIAK